MNLLEVKDLSLEIGETEILRDIDLCVNEGEVTGIIGESGSGKSMTALSIMGLLPRGASVSGNVVLGGEQLLEKSETEMCALRGNEMGMIFQEPMTALNPLKTIGDQVAETVLVHGNVSRAEAMKIARDALDRAELPADEFPLERYPHELSGGQRQRVVIAMAIALRPRLLIADEPTTALDVTTQAQILHLLKRLVKKEGMGLILITHDLAVVADMADRVAIMQKGVVVEAGETLEVFTNMQHPYSKLLFAASNHIPKRSGARKVNRDKIVLSVKGAVRDYPGRRTSLFRKPEPFRAVNGVSFSIGLGENVGLVGESGCGKSTLTRAILGLEALQGGEIRLLGNRVGPGMERSRRSGVQVVFQDPYGSFNPRWKVDRLVAEPLHLLDAAVENRRERVAEALENVGLGASDMDKYIHEFSGGQRQRIAIARALILHPDLIVLDEAVSALDVSIRAQILDLLADISDRLGLSYLFISHDLSVVRAITDRVMVMKEGEIVEEGDSQRVFADPRHPYTRQLIQAAPNIGHALAARQKTRSTT